MSSCQDVQTMAYSSRGWQLFTASVVLDQLNNDDNDDNGSN